MKKKVFIAVSVIVLLLLSAPALAQIGGDRTTPVDLDRPPDQILDPVDPLPPPTEPPIRFTSDEMQLVGFTTRLLPGNEGVLNMSIACQTEFAGSRMCTLGEIFETTYIPRVPGHGFAWVQDSVDPSKSGDQMPDCNGWTSSSPADFGTSIATGICYGGVESQTCNTALPVACCAKEGFTMAR